MGIVYQTDKRSGITYAYENKAYNPLLSVSWWLRSPSGMPNAPLFNKEGNIIGHNKHIKPDWHTFLPTSKKKREQQINLNYSRACSSGPVSL